MCAVCTCVKAVRRSSRIAPRCCTSRKAPPTIESKRRARLVDSPRFSDHMADGSLTLTCRASAGSTSDSRQLLRRACLGTSQVEAGSGAARRLHCIPNRRCLSQSAGCPSPPVLHCCHRHHQQQRQTHPRRGSAESSSATVTGSQPTAATDSSRSPAVLTPLTAERYRTSSSPSRAMRTTGCVACRTSCGTRSVRPTLGEIFESCDYFTAHRPRTSQVCGDQCSAATATGHRRVTTCPGRREARGLEARCRTVRLHRH